MRITVAEPASTETARPGPPSRPKVIYILGAGRSGSTILGVALGNCENVFFAGELDKWLTQSGRPTLDDPERVRFWNEVHTQVNGAEQLFGHQARCLERSSTVFDPRKWAARRRLRAEYRRVAEGLYMAIADVTRATHIVDSSHYPLRARELQSLTGIDLYLLYLVRDPQSVVQSLSRKDVPERSFGTLASNAYLSLTHLFAVPVFLRHPRARRILVRHEDFSADPAGVLAQILQQADVRSSSPDLSSLRTGVALHGNRLLSSEVVSLQEREVQATRRSLVTTVLQLPWRVIFAFMRPASKRAVSHPPSSSTVAEPRSQE